MSEPFSRSDEASLPRDSWLVVLQKLSLALLLVTLLGVSSRGAEIDFLELAYSSGNMLEFGKGFLDPSFTDWREFLLQMWVTVQIAIWGTFLAVVLSVPVGLLCSSNIAPWWIISLLED